MSLMIGAVVIIVIIAGAAFFMYSKVASKNTTQSQPTKETVITEKEVSVSQESVQKVKEKNEKRESFTDQRKNTATVVNNERIKEGNEEKGDNGKKDTKSAYKYAESIEEKAEKELERRSEAAHGIKSAEQAIREKNRQKEQLYRYLNHELQNLFYTYNKGEWDELVLGEISSALYKEKDEIIAGLSSVTGKMLEEYFSCIDFKEEEGKLISCVKDSSKLKEVFLQFMMPFYPYYYKELSEGGLRHTALLHPNTLRLFQQLTGKKFRPGYRNRYTTGVCAFEWDRDRYKVYGKDGRLLCDAIFGADGIIEGYGQKKYPDKEHPDWNIVEQGNWKDGVFQGGILRYEYKKTVK